MRLDRSDEFLTVTEVSTILKLSVLTIYKYIRSNKLEAIELGGHYRIRTSALETFLKRHTLSSRQEGKSS